MVFSPCHRHGGVDFLIGLAVLVILVLVILMLMNKRVVVR